MADIENSKPDYTDTFKSRPDNAQMNPLVELTGSTE
jgi:hypothetical protein